MKGRKEGRRVVKGRKVVKDRKDGRKTGNENTSASSMAFFFKSRMRRSSAATFERFSFSRFRLRDERRNGDGQFYDDNKRPPKSHIENKINRLALEGRKEGK